MQSQPNKIFARIKKFFIFDDILKRVVRNSGWVLSSNVVNLALSFIQSIFVARTLGVGNYGSLGLVMTFVVVIDQLTSFRMNEFVVKFVSDAVAESKPSVAAAVIKFSLLLELSAAVLAFFITILIAPLGAQWILHDPTATDLIKMYALVTLGNLASEAATGILQVFNKFRNQSMFMVVGKVVSLTAVVIAFFANAGLGGVLLAYVLGNVISAALLLAFALRETQNNLGAGWWKVSLAQLNGRWRPIWKFTISTNVSGTLSMIGKQSDVLILGFFRSNIEVGYYNLALQLVNLAVMPVAPLTATMYPELTREVARDNWGSFVSLLKKSSALVSVYMLPVLMGAVMLGELLITLVYKPEYAPAFLPMIILLAGQSYSNIFFWARPALLAMGHADYAVFINAVSVFLKFILVIFLVPAFGYLGNASLVSVLNVLSISVGVYLVVLSTRSNRRNLKVNPATPQINP